MLDIERVNGIIIAPDGSYKSFGIHCDDDKMMKDINFHDQSFKMQLSTNPWFKKLQRKTGIKYEEGNIHNQIREWTRNDVIGLIHGGAYPNDSYFILMPVTLTKKQRILFENNYYNLLNQIESKGAYFEAYIILDESHYLLIDGENALDDFYDKMGLNKVVKGKSNKKVKCYAENINCGRRG